MKTNTKITGLKLVSGLGSAIAIFMVAGCATEPAPEAPSASIPLDDPSMVAQVRQSFNTDREYPYAGVIVTASNGDVKLSGYVLTEWQKYNAAAIAARVPGVKAVDNHVKALNEVAPPTASTVAQQ